MALVVLGFMAVKGVVIYLLTMTMKLPVQERPVLTLLLAQAASLAFGGVSRPPMARMCFPAKPRRC